MLQILNAFDPAALVILVVAVVGTVPIAVYYRDETRVFVLAYACLLVAAFATNVENLVLPEILNLTEHVVGLLGSGLLFAYAAYHRRKNVVTSDDTVEAGTGGAR
jgi:uncharacterized membrane protein